MRIAWCLLVLSPITDAHEQVPRNCKQGPEGFQRPVILAHRGLPGYHLEHTISGYEHAIDSGAQYIEYDVTMTKDDHLIIVHDTWLDSEYNVSSHLRKTLSLMPSLDGDPITKRLAVWQHTLTYKEIQNSSYLCKSYKQFQNNYPRRVIAEEEERKKAGAGHSTCIKPLRVIDATHRLEGIRKEREKEGKLPFGLIVELKRPRFYEALGKDMPTHLAKALLTFKGNIIIQCFEPEYLKKMKTLEEEFINKGTKAAPPEYPRWSYLQLTVDKKSFAALGYPETKTGAFKDYVYTLEEAMAIAVPDDEAEFDAYMNKISKYANIFGPWKRSLQPDDETVKQARLHKMQKFTEQEFQSERDRVFATKNGQKRARKLVASARENGLEVFPFNFFYDEPAEMIYYLELGCTGVFTDFANASVKSALDFCEQDLSFHYVDLAVEWCFYLLTLCALVLLWFVACPCVGEEKMVDRERKKRSL